MSTLKDKFKDFEPQPDPSVWKSISKSLLRPRRRFIYTTSAAAALAAAALFLALHNSPNQKVTSQQPVVASAEMSNRTAEEANVAVVDAQDLGKVVLSKSPDALVPQQNDPAGILVADNPGMVSSDEENISSQVGNAGAQFVVSDDGQQTEAVIIPASKQAQPEVSVTIPTVVSQPIEERRAEPSSVNNEVKKERTLASHNTKAPNEELVVWIPNAFAPDDYDAADDRVRSFRVYPNNGANILSFEMFIYNRNGRQVFHTTDIQKAWDGTYNGHAQPMGTYVYVIQLNDAEKGLQHTKGTVTLVR